MRRLSVLGLAGRVCSHCRHRLSPSGRNGESGAVVVLVAFALGSGVLLGMAALTIDVGSLLYERSQLQNGADAAALSIVKTCAEADKARAMNPASALCAAPDITGSSSLVVLAGANAADAKSDIASVCGSAALVAANPTAFPTTCAILSSPGLVECPTTTSAAKYVEVRTSTRTATGTILPPIFAQTLVGAGAQFSNTTVKACGRVGWGAGKSTGFVLPIAMSYCEWKAATGSNASGLGGTFVTPSPNYSGGVAYGYDTNAGTTAPAWPTAAEHEVYTKATATAETTGPCTTWNGHASPGNFGALVQSPPGSCSATPAGDWLTANQGNSGACEDSQLVPYRGKLVLVPLFDCVAATTDPITLGTDCSNGGEAFYHITGYATFYLTAWQFDGGAGYDRSIADNVRRCNIDNGNSGRCFSGWFTRQVIGAGEIDDTGAPDFGTTVIQVLG